MVGVDGYSGCLCIYCFSSADAGSKGFEEDAVSGPWVDGLFLECLECETEAVWVNDCDGDLEHVGERGNDACLGYELLPWLPRGWLHPFLLKLGFGESDFLFFHSCAVWGQVLPTLMLLMVL